jgi:cysteine-rich repeat protein
VSCLDCSGSASTCTACAQGETIVSNACVCTDANCIACNATSPNCMSCVYTIYGNFSKCDACQTGFYINGANCSPCPGTCLTCGSGGACLTCPDTFQVISGSCECNIAQALWESAGVCISCTVLYPNCQTCVQNTSAALNVSCANCLYAFYLLNESCTMSVCGDSLITSGEACDDGNTISGDGCSSYCQIESNFLCNGTPSVCTINLNYHINFQSVTVSPTVCNHISVRFAMDPVYSSYDNANFSLMFSLVASPSLQYSSCVYQNGVVTYSFDYTDTIDNQTVTFFFAPALLGVNETSTIPIITVSVLLLSDNNLALIYYPQADCDSKASVRALAKTVEYASYGTLALSALPCKIVGLELFGVLQLAYLSTGNMDNVNTMLTPLMEMKGVQGFSMNMGH